MSLDGSRDDPTTRPMPQGNPPSPYGNPHDAGSPAQPYPPVQPGHGWAIGAGSSGPGPNGSSQNGSGQNGSGQHGYGYGQGSHRHDPATQVLPPVNSPVTSVLPGSGPGGPNGPNGPSGGRRRGSERPGGRGWRSPKVLVPATLTLVLAVGAAATVAYVKLRGTSVESAPSGLPSATGRAATLPEGRTWLSGAWTGGSLKADRVAGFGDWRGQPADVVTTYPAYKTWDELKGSDWHVGTLDGFKGRLSYGLPLLPSEDGQGTLADVAAGKHDDAFRAVAEVLDKHGRQDTFVRIGLEANGTWFPWGVGADKAEDFKAAWRHVQGVLKAASPTLSFGFDIGCGTPFQGGSDRLDSLNTLYPGDDVVDVVGCDRYDQYHVKARNQGEWDASLHPSDAAGLADVAEFARAHGKRLAIPEWGLASAQRDGAGDNPFFIYSMYSFFLQNKDILAYENYFNEPEDSLGSAIWDPGQNPKSAAEYQKLWGQKPHLTTTATP